MEGLRRRFSPLVLVNASDAIDPGFAQFLETLSASSYAIKMVAEGEARSTEVFLRFRLVSDFVAESRDADSTAALCAGQWQRAEESEAATFVSIARHSVVPVVNELLLNRLLVDNISTFDHPILVVHLLAPRQALDFTGLHEAWAGYQFSFGDFLQVDAILGTAETYEYSCVPMESGAWHIFLNTLLTDKVYPHISRLVSDSQIKLALSTSQTTFGIATKFFSMGKKLLVTQNPLRGLKHQEETAVSQNEVIGSSTSLNASQLLARRAADFCLMLGNFRQASNIYDSIRKDAQGNREWVLAASSQQWSLLSQLFLGTIPSLPPKDFDMIVQHFLLQKETHMNCMQLVSILIALHPKVSDEIIFPLCSRLTQSSMGGAFKLHIYILQVFIALSVADPKRRLSCLLLERLGRAAEDRGLPDVALNAYGAACELFRPSSYLISLRTRVLQLSLQQKKPVPELALSALVESERVDAATREQCLRMLSEARRGPVDCTAIRISKISVNQRSCDRPRFGANDIPWIKAFCDDYWNYSGALVDPLQMLYTDAELTVPFGSLLNVAVELTCALEMRLTEVCLLTDREAFGATSNAVCSASTPLWFAFNVDKPVQLIGLEFRANGILSRLLFPLKGFRLNLTKQHRITPTYSQAHDLTIRPLPTAELYDVALEALDDFGCIAVDQELRVQLALKNLDLTEAKIFRVFVLTPGVRSARPPAEANGLRVITGITVGPGATELLDFTLHVTQAGQNDLRLAVVLDGSKRHPRLARLIFRAEAVVRIAEVRLHGVDLPGPKLLSLTLQNLCDELLGLKSVHLAAGEASIHPLARNSVMVRPGIPSVVSFPVSVSIAGPRLVLGLKNGATLVLRVEVPPVTKPCVTWTKLLQPSENSGLLLHSFEARVHGAELFTCEDLAASQSFYIGEIGKTFDAAEDKVAHVTALSTNGAYIHLPSPMSSERTFVIQR